MLNHVGLRKAKECLHVLLRLIEALPMCVRNTMTHDRDVKVGWGCWCLRIVRSNGNCLLGPYLPCKFYGMRWLQNAAKPCKCGPVVPSSCTHRPTLKNLCEGTADLQRIPALCCPRVNQWIFLSLVMTEVPLWILATKLSILWPIQISIPYLMSDLPYIILEVFTC